MLPPRNTADQLGARGRRMIWTGTFLFGPLVIVLLIVLGLQTLGTIHLENQLEFGEPWEARDLIEVILATAIGLFSLFWLATFVQGSLWVRRGNDSKPPTIEAHP